jgi:hypothetical protein
MTETVTRSCDTCRFAEWQKTANGRLHPGKQGKCTWQAPVYPIPKAVSYGWQGGGKPPVEHHGRYISRDKYMHKDCEAWEAK